MTQEQKDLLLKDLCARSPYGVKCGVFDDAYIKTLSGVLPGNVYNELYFKELDWKDCNGFVDVRYCKPYLFPLSSMTEEQIKEWNILASHFAFTLESIKIFAFYHQNHIDYNGLIEKGLAIDATGLNIY
jgi:hypothetical protein